MWGFVSNVPCQEEATAHSLCVYTNPEMPSSLILLYSAPASQKFQGSLLQGCHEFEHTRGRGLVHCLYSNNSSNLPRSSIRSSASKCFLSTYSPALRSALYEMLEYSVNRTDWAVLLKNFHVACLCTHCRSPLFSNIRSFACRHKILP